MTYFIRGGGGIIIGEEMPRLKNWEKKIDRPELIVWEHRDGSIVRIEKQYFFVSQKATFGEFTMRNVGSSTSHRWIISAEGIEIKDELSSRYKDKAIEYAMHIMKNHD